ncbi:hypothetical protein B7P43_G08750 [Cryptotermes secundus]|uniref:BHLH domain-containing protein n=1 Tax=Cryptotermes secundus TaxID=105785 RepID=A0A2J7RNT7_9NEOP|nr:hypothetical protein B7P43_G08750 [Cryptotermes secundus]
MTGILNDRDSSFLERTQIPIQRVLEAVEGLSDRAASPSSHMEQEKRIRREIANSNERRRMQSINAGFQSLRTLLPHHEGEKLSKVSLSDL